MTKYFRSSANCTGIHDPAYRVTLFPSCLLPSDEACALTSDLLVFISQWTIHSCNWQRRPPLCEHRSRSEICILYNLRFFVDRTIVHNQSTVRLRAMFCLELVVHDAVLSEIALPCVDNVYPMMIVWTRDVPGISDARKDGLLTWDFARCKYLCFRKPAPSVRRCVSGNCLPVGDYIKQFVNNTESQKMTTRGFLRRPLRTNCLLPFSTLWPDGATNSQFWDKYDIKSFEHTTFLTPALHNVCQHKQNRVFVYSYLAE